MEEKHIEHLKASIKKKNFYFICIYESLLILNNNFDIFQLHKFLNQFFYSMKKFIHDILR